MTKKFAAALSSTERRGPRQPTSSNSRHKSRERRSAYMTHDTARVMAGGGPHSGGSMKLAATIVGQATDDIIAQGRKIASHLLEAGETDIEFEHGRFRIAGTDRELGLFEVAQATATRTDLPAELQGPLAAVSDQTLSKAGVSPDSVTRAAQDGAAVTRKTWGAIQQALEEAGIEFLPEINSVSLHMNPDEAAISADPAMPLGVRRIYPRSAAEEIGRYTVSIVRLPLPRYPLSEMPPEGHSITRTSYRVETEAAALARSRELIQAGYGIEVTGPNLRWDRAEVMRKLNETPPA